MDSSIHGTGANPVFITLSIRYEREVAPADEFMEVRSIDNM